MKRARGWILAVVRFGVTAGLLVVVIRRAGAETLLHELAKVSPRWLLAATLINVAFVVVTVSRWRLLITTQPVGLTLPRLIRLQLMSAFYGSLAPGTLGIDAVRAVLLARQGMGRTAAAISVAADRGLGFLGTLFMATPALLTSGALFRTAAVPWVGRLGEIRGKAQSALAGLLRQPWRLVGAFGLSLTASTLWGAVGWCTLVSLGHAVPFSALVSFVACAELLSAVPVSVQGVGVRELVLTTFLGRYGVSTADATLLGLLIYSQALVIICVGGIAALASPGLSAKTLAVERG